MRVLTDLFMRYGVDAVFAGHDEMYEHSLIPDGVERLPGDGNKTRPHILHVYDVGIAGDGLRGPYAGPGSDHPEFPGNPDQVFLAHHNAPEVWDGKRLVSGGQALRPPGSQRDPHGRGPLAGGPHPPPTASH